MHEWLCVGRAERIPEPGDWFTVTICDEPIIVARDKAGDVRAMSAVCQHRAMQVCEGEGNDTTFKCPYHHWIYGLDGRLLGAPAMERTEDFDKTAGASAPLAVEEWQGFVFVNFDADAAPLAPTLARYEPYLEQLRPGQRGLPRHVHARGPAVELEGHVRELQRRLPRQPAAPVRPGLLPERNGRVPRPWDDDSNVDLPHRRLHPHRRWLQRHPPGHHAGVPRPHRGGADGGRRSP